MLLQDEVTALANAGRALAAEGLVKGTAGNLSVRAGDKLAVTASGVALEAITPREIAITDLDGKPVGGALSPTSEIDLHAETYRLHDVGAIVHTHSPAATALACTLDEVPCIHYLMLSLGGAIPVVGYQTFGTAELGHAIAEALEGRSAVLMANHGTITTGRDLDQAMENTRLLEWLCDLYTRSAGTGTPRELTADEQEQARLRLQAYRAG
jgi:L-fuculose-phosphate aldolase